MEICLIRLEDFFERKPRVWKIEPHAVHEVRAEQGHGDDVENGDGPTDEAIDDHLPGVVDFLPPSSMVL